MVVVHYGGHGGAQFTIVSVRLTSTACGVHINVRDHVVREWWSSCCVEPRTPRQQVLIGNACAITNCMFSQDAQYLFTNSKDGQILIFKCTDGVRQKSLLSFRDVALDRPWNNYVVRIINMSSDVGTWSTRRGHQGVVDHVWGGGAVSYVTRGSMLHHSVS